MAESKSPLPNEAVKSFEKTTFTSPVDAGINLEKTKGGDLQVSEFVMQSLQGEITRLQTENISLKKNLRVVSKQRIRTPDDFSTALSHSIDSLQTRLSQMKNPISNFAVRELTLETNVHIEVTELGTIDYRFVGPGDDIPPENLSKLKINLVPLPKESNAGSWTYPAFTPYVDIDEIQGIGEAYKEKLNEHQIFTVSDLVNVSTRMRSKVELASMLEVDHKRLGEWVSHAEMMTIRTIDGRAAEVLYNIGITSLEKLSNAGKEALTAQYNNMIAKMKFASLSKVTEEQAQEWIEAAKSFVGRSTRYTTNVEPGKPDK